MEATFCFSMPNVTIPPFEMTPEATYDTVHRHPSERRRPPARNSPNSLYSAKKYWISRISFICTIFVWYPIIFHVCWNGADDVAPYSRNTHRTARILSFPSNPGLKILFSSTKSSQMRRVSRPLTATLGIWSATADTKPHNDNMRMRYTTLGTAQIVDKTSRTANRQSARQ